MKPKSPPFIALEEHKRGCPWLRCAPPQQLESYKLYEGVYKEEEEERSDRWRSFLERRAESSGHVEPMVSLSVDEAEAVVCVEENVGAGSSQILHEKTAQGLPRIEPWKPIRPSLGNIKQMMGLRVDKKHPSAARLQSEESTHLVMVEEAKVSGDSDDEFYDADNVDPSQEVHLGDSVNAEIGKMSQEETYSLKEELERLVHGVKKMLGLRVENKHSSSVRLQSEESNHFVTVEEAKVSGDWDDEFYGADNIDPSQEVHSGDSVNAEIGNMSQEETYSLKEELELLVPGGLPMALRGELWQAFVGVEACRVKGYYNSLLASEGEVFSAFSFEMWKWQIEKDLPRTFPGHPALDEDGRNALRRLLLAYARHNSTVGYCQAMNFFAGLLLVLMPEENAFWTLVGIIDDYFCGYFSEEKIEWQVDQLVLQELVHENFPELANHLDYFGVKVAGVTGPWLRSIFTNVLPWESVLRVWDVLLFYGNRVMLFRTALVLLEFYGPALVATKDAHDAVTLLQSLAGSTFESTHLVMSACMQYESVNETVLRELRNKHRPFVLS